MGRLDRLRPDDYFGRLGWRHELWQYVRLYHSILTRKHQKEELLDKGTFGPHVVPPDLLDLLRSYITYREQALDQALSLLRTEEEANRFCDEIGVSVGVTATQSQDHHQSTKPMVAAVSYIADRVAAEYGKPVDTNPTRSCLWTKYGPLTVTARNLDGALPRLENPIVIWEIKEYWGKTKGGSKMSDALYECLLVGMELRLMEEQTGERIAHVALLDGREQWGHRLSDLRRFIDILNQGLLDALIIGKEVEYEWESLLDDILRHHYEPR